MKTTLKITLASVLLIAISCPVNAQDKRIGEVIILGRTALNQDVKPEAFRASMREIIAAWNKGESRTSLRLFQADRGKLKGEFLLACVAAKIADRETLPPGNPFSVTVQSKAGAASQRPSDFLVNSDAYTEYRLIGAEKFKFRPLNGILGIHKIQVKKDRAADFEKLVTEKLHPAVGQLFTDMQLLYYKAVAGEQTGSYILIFNMESVTARERYWPTGQDETEAVKKGFRPHNDLAAELGTYLVEGSFLAPGGGGDSAAAFWESKEWTDFVGL